MLMTGAGVIVTAVLLFGSVDANSMQEPKKPAAAAGSVAVPDTAAGKALQEFVDTFNAGGEKRRVWVEGRTTIGKDGAAGILKQDGEVLNQHGAMTIVRVPSSSAGTITAVVRHEKTGAHGHLTLTVDTSAPYKVTNMQLRGATPEEIKG